MKNLWNTEMKIEFNSLIRENIINWHQKIKNQKSHLRKEYIKRNPLDDKSKNYLQEKYDEGYGYKVIARELKLSYTQTRNLFLRYLNLNVRTGQDVVTEKVRKFRSNRVKGKNNPFYDWPKLKGHLHDSSKKGIQGYYKKKSGQYIWLRSSWEYIYAKWLDSKNINWEYEPKSYKLSNGETYRPDFKILDENNFYFVEVKGALYKERLYKVKMFREEYPEHKIIIIMDIKKYTKIGYKKELKIWKNIKLSEKQLKKLKS